MGGCASVYKKDLKIMRRRVKTDRAIVRPESPVRITEPAPVDFPLKSIDDADSKGETFYDSNVWLDSDCEDDFFSVNGDFTPSRGNTPVHHRFSTGKPLIIDTGNVVLQGSAPEPSPKKKSLSELFEDSTKEDLVQNQKQINESQNVGLETAEMKSIQQLPPISRTNGGAITERKASFKSAKCCFPNVITLNSFNERKKMSPTRAVGITA